jgi:hypothetical protein
VLGLFVYPEDGGSRFLRMLVIIYHDTTSQNTAIYSHSYDNLNLTEAKRFDFHNMAHWNITQHVNVLEMVNLEIEEPKLWYVVAIRYTECPMRKGQYSGRS